ncbi:hypothetical protein [Microbulbifer sp. THAF38]|uniref:hypothetical protein n=1 Tax=Microbulbifer sp. THAF38 TaxID=2587856 RepID=UPI001C12A106|nr:hypothetical protein [Microbulbifer sp. THAF38]
MGRVMRKYIRLYIWILVFLSVVTLVVSKVLAEEWSYKDDRSSPEALIESYYYAINHRYYAQAYSYLINPPADFNQWKEGYGDTKSVKVKFGATSPDPGAGQIYWALPVALLAKKTDGKTVVYSGCYVIHMINPGMQGDPPYKHMGIFRVSLKETNQPFEEAVPKLCK